MHTERQSCRLRNGYGTRKPVVSLVATLAASLAVNGGVEINIPFQALPLSATLSLGVNRLSIEHKSVHTQEHPTFRW